MKNMTNFPYDEQVCEMQYGPLITPVDLIKMKLQNDSTKVVMADSFFQGSGEFSIVDSKLYNCVLKMTDVNNQETEWDFINIAIHFKRRQVHAGGG